MLRDQKKEPETIPFATITFIIVTAAIFGFLLSKTDFTRLIFGEIGQPVAETNQVTQSKIEPVPKVITKKPDTDKIKPPSPQPESIMIDSIYRYTDENDVLAMVDSLDKVPNRYRANMKVSGRSSNAQKTPVTIRDNKISVPVSIGYQGRTINVQLWLDTGATGMVISPAIAQQLGIRQENTRRGNSIIANGMTVTHYNVTADYVTVGPKTKRNIELSVLPQANNEITGLLGMSFLSGFPHMVDIKAGVIKWM